MRVFWIFFLPALSFGSISSDLNLGLRALQQIRTLIPERLVDEEFSIIIDKQSFAEAYRSMSYPMHAEETYPAKGICHSHFYYTRWTLSGEPIRMLDFYQEFEYGPYWLYPSATQRLSDMHHPNVKQK